MPVIEASFGTLALWAVLGYLLGSIPFGLVLAKAMDLGDLRQIGSGNIGATNVLRTGSKKAAALTLLLDGAKGAAAVLLARWIVGEDAAQIAALFAFLGHCYPVWLNFRGGKGVATFLGILLALSWPVGLASCAAWLFTALLGRISSLAALVAAATSPLWMLVFGVTQALVLGGILTLLLFWRHSSNIARLKAGTEPRVGQK
ncbi:glycerol-3-phosphate 1-O-acyltransferase PlsY [Marimonas arenosa]|uniref:Glycerol-3-phosphate acyltransferase n=1 Tax=Marimonas arenosa TaxID=1795305 RepID=A0AAE3WHD3_9RHOB|nr:glycerol-3-phosphate 1-O-acyltransferase PlsY [Marimonas arenosa]MDQ2091720.1 glycerol-3-phosphate 1-O-acyltransferase PlsY [Marimonas arenosa]